MEQYPSTSHVHSFSTEDFGAIPSIRLLEVADEGAFRDLLESVYGDTYSYRHLSQVGEFSKLLNAGKLMSIGEFDPCENLIGHTSLILKDPEGEFLESGGSFRKHQARGGALMAHAKFWSKLLPSLGERFTFLYQNTTTFHPLAQRYAKRLMHAIPTGIIFNYTWGEKIPALGDFDEVMHALTMLTVLKKKGLRKQVLYLPVGCWGDWLQAFVELQNLPREIIRFDLAESPERVPYSFTELEWNAPLALLRRRVQFHSRREAFVRPSRTDLIHLPCEGPNGLKMGAVLKDLSRLNYFPVGYRPRDRNSDEIILQRIRPEGLSLESLLSGLKIDDPETRKKITQWARCYRQTL